MIGPVDHCSRRPANASGYSLIELLVALVLGGLVTAAAAALFHNHVRLARTITNSTEREEAFRIAAQVLQAETRWLHPLRDVRAFSADSLLIRAMRASGVVCQVLPDGSAIVGLDAMRAPDTDKDSVLILRDSIQELVAQLQEATATPHDCGARTHYRIRTTLPMQPGDYLLVFESGAYYLSDRALRYRLGAAGRQPLTSEAFSAHHFESGIAGGWASLSIASSRHRTESVRIRLPFLNHLP